MVFAALEEIKQTNVREKRFYKRCKFELGISNPIINNKKLDTSFFNEPLLRAVNISEGGICFFSKLDLKVSQGDSISFFLKIDGTASFECLVLVRWKSIDDEGIRIGCEFAFIHDQHKYAIKRFISDGITV